MQLTLRSKNHTIVVGPSGNLYVCEKDMPNLGYSIDIAVDNGWLTVDFSPPAGWDHVEGGAFASDEDRRKHRATEVLLLRKVKGELQA
jgi:hypothetical protein